MCDERVVRAPRPPGCLAARGRCSSFEEHQDWADCQTCIRSNAKHVVCGTLRKALRPSARHPIVGPRWRLEAAGIHILVTEGSTAPFAPSCRVLKTSAISCPSAEFRSMCVSPSIALSLGTEPLFEVLHLSDECVDNVGVLPIRRLQNLVVKLR